MKEKHRQTKDSFPGITPSSYKELHHRHKEVLRIFSRYGFERVLDVGCGDGNFTLLIKEACRGKEMYGVEIVEKGVEEARKKSIKAYRVDLDTENLPFENEFFDAVFAGEVIEHLFDPDHFLDEVYRVLKHKGILVLTTPNLASLHNRIALLLGYQPFPMGVSLRFNIGRLIEPAEEPQSLDHIRLFTLRALKKLIELHGFRIVEVKGSSALLPLKNYYFKVIAFIDNLLTIIPSLAYRIIIVAEKI